MNATLIITFALGGSLLLALIILMVARVGRRPLEIIANSANEPASVAKIIFPNWLSYLYIFSSSLFIIIEFFVDGRFDRFESHWSLYAAGIVTGAFGSIHYKSLLRRFPTDTNAHSSVKFGLWASIFVVLTSLYLFISSFSESERSNNPGKSESGSIALAVPISPEKAPETRTYINSRQLNLQPTVHRT